MNIEGYCPHCSGGGQSIFHGGPCPNVKAVEYFPDGRIKRIEYVDKTPVIVQPTPMRPWYEQMSGHVVHADSVMSSVTC